jgi:cobalt/nickel transport system permease protein
MAKSGPIVVVKRKSAFLLEYTDPRIRLISAFVISFTIASLSSLQSAALALFFGVFFTMASGQPVFSLIKRLLLVNTFIIFMWFMLPFSFSSPGEIIGSIGPLEVTREGVNLALLLTLKANAILLTIISLLCLGPIHIMAEAARSLGAPNKLVNLFLLSTRYFYVIFAEYERLTQAMKARGFKASFSWHTIKSLSSLLGILLVRSFDRADRIHKAMLARGYTGDLYIRTDFHFQKLDVIFIISSVLITFILVFTEWQTKI